MSNHFIPARSKQAGVVLLISLIMLIILTLGSLALFRQVGTGVMVASNLAFKSSALMGSDLGLEAARGWLTSSSADLTLGHPTNGYYAAWCNSSLNANNEPDANNDGVVDDCKANQPSGSNDTRLQFDPLTYNWTNSVQATADDGNGNGVRYVIHRLCRIPGALNFTDPSGTPQECVTLNTVEAGQSKSETSYAEQNLKNKVQPYFRITTQTTGPRNTVVYTQMIMY